MLTQLRPAKFLSAFRRDKKGVAAVEFGLIAIVMAVTAVNTADLALYLIDKIQVENAAQMGAQAAWQACDLEHIPATKKCPNVNASITAAIQKTSLGNAVTLVAGSPAEGYYCVNGGGSLQYVSDTNSKPGDCSAAGVPANVPADYIQVQTTYTYKPLFSASVGSALKTPITRTAWMRLG